MHTAEYFVVKLAQLQRKKPTVIAAKNMIEHACRVPAVNHPLIFPRSSPTGLSVQNDFGTECTSATVVAIERLYYIDESKD
jgi:hypothetical protein